VRVPRTWRRMLSSAALAVAGSLVGVIAMSVKGAGAVEKSSRAETEGKLVSSDWPVMNAPPASCWGVGRRGRVGQGVRQPR
jgi:hypothetical protein